MSSRRFALTRLHATALPPCEAQDATDAPAPTAIAFNALRNPSESTRLLAVGDDCSRVHLYTVGTGHTPAAQLDDALVEEDAAQGIHVQLVATTSFGENEGMRGNHDDNDDDDDDDDAPAVTSVAFHPTRTNELYAACGTHVVVMDVENELRVLRVHVVAEDEINAVAIHPKGTFFAVADDTGRASVCECGTADEGGASVPAKPRKVIRSAHDGICSAIAFAGSRRPWDIVTAGYDCTARLHDFSTGKVKAEADMRTTSPSSSTGAPEEGREMCNPPFVHAVAVLDPPGNSVVVCRGDGRIALWSYGAGGGGAMEWLGGACEMPGAKRQAGHASAATSVAVCHIHDNVLAVTGGNDRRLILWDVSNDAPWRSRDGSHGDVVAAPLHVVKHAAGKVNMLAADGAYVAVADTSDGVSLYCVLQKE